MRAYPGADDPANPPPAPPTIVDAVDRVVAIIDSIPERHRDELLEALIDRLGGICRGCGKVGPDPSCCYLDRE